MVRTSPSRSRASPSAAACRGRWVVMRASLPCTGTDTALSASAWCWFSEPTYVNRLCPRVTLNGSNIYREVGTNVIKITRIDPSQVNVEVVPDRGVFYMIRDSDMGFLIYRFL
jgi:hypothetical protein